jgi:hypothetical protein
MRWQRRRFDMGLFKKKIVKEIDGGAWGHLVNVHKMDVDTLTRQMRCVDREGVLDDGAPVTFLRVFRLKEVEEVGVAITGWETFDQHPELIIFEGYITRKNQAFLDRKKG